jgi:hypothetical protein
LVSHRRPHPSRRERILFLRRPHRRHLPLEGREHRDIGGGGAITSFPGILDANVYGVALPGTDGRAGMAELVCARPIDLAAFRDHLMRCVPRYAHPVLLRVQNHINVTRPNG